MSKELVVYLSDKLKQWNVLVGEFAQEIENTDSPDLRNYYLHIMIQMQLARNALADALAEAITSQFTDNLSAWQNISYSLN